MEPDYDIWALPDTYENFVHIMFNDNPLESSKITSIVEKEYIMTMFPSNYHYIHPSWIDSTYHLWLLPQANTMHHFDLYAEIVSAFGQIGNPVLPVMESSKITSTFEIEDCQIVLVIPSYILHSAIISIHIFSFEFYSQISIQQCVFRSLLSSIQNFSLENQTLTMFNKTYLIAQLF